MPDNDSLRFNDRPIDDLTDDRLGFLPMSRRLAAALINNITTDGLVVGLEGKWGSGKSSLLNITINSIFECERKNLPIIVEFKPWLVGDRDILIRSFFEHLASQIEKIELVGGNSRARDKREREELANKMRGYAASAEKFGSIIAAVPMLSAFGNIVKAVGNSLKNSPEKMPLGQQKQELNKSLEALRQRIIVTIDDVDRLEPKEVIEVLRLVRSVADFKNITYIMCFDVKILTRSIETAVNIDDGFAYLEKIIQIMITVPAPEPFVLRRWFSHELSKFATTSNLETNLRLAAVIDQEGGRRLETPRAVVRTISALSFLVPALESEKIDLPDLVWLQMIKNDNQSFYRWIEDYCIICAAVSGFRASIDKEFKKNSFDDLQKILSLDRSSFEKYRYDLAEHLPGIEMGVSSNSANDVPLYQRQSDDEISLTVRDRRLASPDHYRIYFALAQPSTAPRIEDFEQLFAAASKSKSDVVKLLKSWAHIDDPSIGTKADVMLNRLKRQDPDTLSSDQAESLFLALADTMDEVSEIAGVNDFGLAPIWDEAKLCIPTLRTSIGGNRIFSTLKNAFANGQSLGWLTSVLRDETFNHGLFGDRPKSESDRLFSNQELDIIIKCMLNRYRKMSFEDFASLPNTIGALFAWAQAGDPDGPRQLVKSFSETEAGLIRFLEVMSNLVRSSGGNFMAINRRNIESFADYDSIYARIVDISQNKSSKNQLRAAEIRERIVLGEKF